MMTGLLLESALRAFVLGVMAWAGLAIFRVRSAQARHLVWSLVLGVAMALPLVGWVLDQAAAAPAIVIPVTISESVADVATPIVTAPIRQNGRTLAEYAVAAYAGISAALSLRLLTGLWLTWGIARRAKSVQIGARVSDELRSPVTFASTILLPANYTRWTPDTLEAVLRHEGEHCRRGDFYTQLAARVYRAAFWAHPLAWYLNRELAILAEEICDDAAMRERTEVADRAFYAELLLAFATKSQIATESAVAMARLTAVTHRVERLLDQAFEPTKRMSAAARWGTAALLVPVVALVSTSSIALLAQDSGNKIRPSLAIVDGSNNITMMNGSTSDSKRIRELQMRQGGGSSTVLWLRHQDGKEYTTSDPVVIAQVKELFAPQSDLGKRQAELGEQQAALGKKQAELGQMQAKAGAGVPDLAPEIKRLSEKVAQLHQSGKANADDLGALQAVLGDMQSRIGHAHGDIGARQAEIGVKMAELGKLQAELGSKQAMLGQRQAEIARKAMAEVERMTEKLIQEKKLQPVK